MPTITEINGDNEEQQQRNHLAIRSNRLAFTAKACHVILSWIEPHNEYPIVD